MRTVGQRGSRNINRHKEQITALPNQRLNNLSRLLSAATAQFNQGVAFRKSSHDLFGMRRKNLIFGTREVVFGNLPNGFKQARAELVVQVLRKKEFRICG